MGVLPIYITLSPFTSHSPHLHHTLPIYITLSPFTSHSLVWTRYVPLRECSSLTSKMWVLGLVWCTVWYMALIWNHVSCDVWHLLSPHKYVMAFQIHLTTYTRLCECFPYMSDYVRATNVIWHMASALYTQICDCSACAFNCIHTTMWALCVYIRLRGRYKYDTIHGICSLHTNMWLLCM